MNLYVDTCVLPRCALETGRIYRERFGSSLGFELLMMFDLPDFEKNLEKNLDLFAEGPLLFHEPVWGVSHAAKRGSPLWAQGMYHLRLTKKFADILRPAAMVVHLSNGPVPPGLKSRMLRHALENLEELRDMFPETDLLTENTGIRADGTLLLDQAEFTDLCREKQFPVLVDVGHAHANGWDLPRLIQDLGPRIRGFHLHNNDGLHDLHNRLRDGTLDIPALLPVMDREAPEAARVIEYTRPAFHGDPLAEDIAWLAEMESVPPRGGQKGGAEDAV